MTSSDPTKHIFPEPSTRCSRITLLVTLDYLEPFTAPPEWDYEGLLTYALNNEREVTIDASVDSYIPWVDLEIIQYRLGGQVHQTTKQDERDYRIYCEGECEQPSREGFWNYILINKHQIAML